MSQDRNKPHCFFRTALALLVSAGISSAIAEADEPVRVAKAMIEGCSDENIIGTALLQEPPSSEGFK